MCSGLASSFLQMRSHRLNRIVVFLEDSSKLLVRSLMALIHMLADC